MRLIALEYHDVVDPGNPDMSGFPGNDAATYKLDRPTFVAHLEAIRRRELPHPTSVFKVPKQPQTACPLLTFDDGGSSAGAIADLLDTLGWIGHFFITTGRIGTGGFVTKSQIQDLWHRGHVVGSHSESHPTRMAACTTDQLSREWTRSIDTLSSLLGAPVQIASVPGGYYDRRVATTAAAAGIEVLFTSEPTTRRHIVGNCCVLGRYTMRHDSTALTAAAIAGGRLGPRLSQAITWNAKKAAKVVAGKHYLRLRSWLLR
jgi:peptidoglycan/xylan/chitin deacetylase (PgdA/CDA1 family)